MWYSVSLKNLELVNSKIQKIEESIKKNETAYLKACSQMKSSFSGDVRVAAANFKMLGDYKDSAQKRVECLVT